MSRTPPAMKALVSSELERVPETGCKDRLAGLLVEPSFVPKEASRCANAATPSPESGGSAAYERASNF